MAEIRTAKIELTEEIMQALQDAKCRVRKRMAQLAWKQKRWKK